MAAFHWSSVDDIVSSMNENVILVVSCMKLKMKLCPVYSNIRPSPTSIFEPNQLLHFSGTSGSEVRERKKQAEDV